MPYNPNKHDRRSIRLKGYDYTSPGAYFITLCTHDRQCFFGEIVEGVMQLNDWGQIVEQGWLAIPTHQPHVALDQFVVMPNHFHGILIIGAGDGGNTGDPICGKGEAFASKPWVFPKDPGANASPLRRRGPNGTQPGSFCLGIPSLQKHLNFRHQLF